MRRLPLVILLCVQLCLCAFAEGWHVAKVLPQKHFSRSVPAGNYSGITHLYDDIYAVVSDKSDSCLYFYFQIQIDTLSGKIENVTWLGGAGRVEQAGLDHEAIVRVSDTTLVIASEGKARLSEYRISDREQEQPLDAVAETKTADSETQSADAVAEMQPTPSLWEWFMPTSLFYGNYNFESLAYDAQTGLLWTMPESTMKTDGQLATPQNGRRNALRLMALDMHGDKAAQGAAKGRKPSLHATYCYLMDAPTTHKQAQTYVMGVSELCAIGGGHLVALEREAFVPKAKLGSFCRCKLYEIGPGEQDRQQTSSLQDISPLDTTVVVAKRLLAEWKTGLTLTDRSFANYEGMCLGPRLADGGQVLILLSDSQDQYAGVLRDYFRSVVLRPQQEDRGSLE